MVKPPKSMQPESNEINLAKAGRDAGKAFQEDSFRNYMARKIDLQRKQFGVQLPPDPRLVSAGEKKRKQAPSTESPTKKKNVSFAQDVKDNDASVNSHKKRKQNKGAIKSILKKLELRHGKSYKRRSSQRRNKRESSTIYKDECHAIEGGDIESSTSSIQKEGKFVQSDNETSASNQDEILTKEHKCVDDDVITRALEREQREEQRQKQQQQFHQNPDNEGDSNEEEHDEDEKEDDNKKFEIDATLRPSPRLRRDRPDLFFIGVVIMINGYTNPDSETLQRLVHKHGGDLVKYEVTRLTHIIAEHLSTAKANIYKQQRKPVPVVKPAWIVDCVQAGRLLPYGDYLIEEVKDKTATMRSFFVSAQNTSECSGNGVVASTTEEVITISDVSMATGLGDTRGEGASSDTSDFLPASSEAALLRPVPQQSCERNAANISGGELCPMEEKIRTEHTIVTVEQLSDMPCNQAALENIGDEAPEDNVKDAFEVPKDHFSDIADASMDHLEEDTESPTLQPGLPENPGSQSQRNGELRSSYQHQPHQESGKPDGKYINGRIRTVGTDPKFLESFFENSRLSFIGSYKQRTKESPQKQANRPAAERNQRFIFHVDMDCFFASVVLRNYPEYRNSPVVISHFGRTGGEDGDYQQFNKNSSSECATCNYEARKYGIKKGMYLGEAKELCPNLVVLPYDFDGYEEVSEKVTAILQEKASRYYGEVEQVSCDESYVELFLPAGNNLNDPSNYALEVAGELRNDIFRVTRCTATVGVGGNKFLAKLGTDRVKPNGAFVVRDHTELLKNLRLKDLHGIGYRTDRKLAENGLVFVQDVWDLGDGGEQELVCILGPGLGKKIFAFCRGEDERPVRATERKTIGAECNYGVRFDGPYGVDYMVAGLAKEVQRRMECVDVRGSRITLKIMQRKEGAPPPPKFLGHGSCYNLSKSMNIAKGPSRDRKVIGEAGMQLFMELKVPVDDIRGMGIVMSKLDCSATETTAVSDMAQSITNWLFPKTASAGNATDTAFGTGSEPQKENKKRASEFSPSRDLNPEKKNISYGSSNKFSYIDEAMLLELPPDIQDELRKEVEGLSDLGVKDDLKKKDNSDAHRGEGLPEKMPVPDQPSSLHSAGENNNQDGSLSPEPKDISFDVALPPMSQLHMSQVEALPSPLRKSISAQLQKHFSCGPPGNLRESSKLSGRQSNVVGQNECATRYRQVNVKRLFRLATIKSGKSSTISASELEHLPLEMQLQVANNDDCGLGMLSQHLEQKAKASTCHKDQRPPNFSRRTNPSSNAHPLEGPPHPHKVCLPSQEHSPQTNENNQHKEAMCHPYTSDLSNDFYTENVAPLALFMDKNKPSNEQALYQVIDFLCICVKERRQYDVTLLLRNIRNRRDPWGGPAYGRIFSEVDDQCQEVEGVRFDRNSL